MPGHTTHNSEDKNKFNHISNELNRIIKDINRGNFSKYVEELSPHEDKDYPFWQAVLAKTLTSPHLLISYKKCYQNPK